MWAEPPRVWSQRTHTDTACLNVTSTFDVCRNEMPKASSASVAAGTQMIPAMCFSKLRLSQMIVEVRGMIVDTSAASLQRQGSSDYCDSTVRTRRSPRELYSIRLESLSVDELNLSVGTNSRVTRLPRVLPKLQLTEIVSVVVERTRSTVHLQEG